ncbi:Vacuolar protein sorting-associated protein 8, partial [Phytophthora palmivora]
MASRTAKRSLLAFLIAMTIAIACMLVLSMQVPSVAAAAASSRDFKRFGINEAFDEDEEDDDEWDFMDDDAILGLSKQPNSGEKEDMMEIKAMCVDSLPIERVDDDYCDCEDGSDEPSTSACSYVLLSSEKPPFGREFNCKADDKLVPLAFVSDDVCDCCDGSDEKKGVCSDTCETEWLKRLKSLRERLDMVQRGQRIRKGYLVGAVDKVTKLQEDFERIAEHYQAGQRAFEDLQRQAQQNPELRGQLEQSYNVLRRVQYVAYVQSRVAEQSTFSDAAWKPAFVELAGQCFSYTVDEKELKGGTPNVIPRKYDMVLCPFQNVSQTEPLYPSWAKAEHQTKGGVTAVDDSEEEIPRPIGLGIWNGWQDSIGFTRVQNYNHGEPCANGQERQVRVELSCSATNRIVSVEEREMCEYEIRFETPAACGEAEESALQAEISQVKAFPKELLPQQGAKDELDSKPQGHEELTFLISLYKSPQSGGLRQENLRAKAHDADVTEAAVSRYLEQLRTCNKSHPVPHSSVHLLVMSGVESLLLESDEEDLGEVDLSAITLEEILREEELANRSTENGESREDGDDLFFSPATFTINIEPGPGMDVIPAPKTTTPAPVKTETHFRTPLEIAEAREKQLLSCVGVELISPLQVKRRLRAHARSKALKSRREGLVAMKKNQRKKKIAEGAGTAAVATEKKSTGVVKVEPMEAISRQLRKNIEFKEYGPGSPTVVAIHSKFIAIGTSKGLVIIFDHFQNIRQVLGNTNDADGDGPVTAVDVSPGSDYLVCGYQSGRIVLWDMIKGTSLKAVSDAHENPVVSLRFLKDQKPVLVSVDTNGLVNKLNFSKMMGMVYVVDVDPLYDGSAGKILSISVLPQSAGNAKISYLTDQYCLAALSTETVTFLKDQKPVLVSVDTNGLVNKLNFSKMMGMVYVVDVDPLYDGSAGKILSISVLPQSAGNAKISYLTDQYCLAALSTETVTFIIAIEPEVRVIYRWARPDDIAPDDPVLPTLAFAWISFPGSSRALAPVLARGWGNRVQFLEVVFPGGKNHSHARHGFPTFDEHDQIESSSAVMAVQWLGDQVVVYLNSHDEICVYDVMSRQELEIVDVSSLELVFASYRGKNARSFSNSFRGCYNILYLLGLKELQTARVLPWTQRIDLLVDDGEWLEALALALDHYEGLKIAAADRAARDRFPPVFFRDKQNDQCLVDILHMCQTNQRTGEKEDVFRHEESADEVRWVCGEVPYPPDIAKKLEETLQKARSGEVTKNFVPISVAERVADLLMEYVRLAIANAPGSTAAAGGELSLNKIGMKLDLAKSHYQMLAGVCIEYCALIGRTDLLFGEIYSRFKDANKLSVLVELLEPYILSEKLRNLSPVAMEEFVRHFSEQGKLAQVEQCLLHLNVAELDMDTILKLCHDHELYSALIYIYNEGMDDYTTPIDVLLEACSDAKASKAKPAPEPTRVTRAPSGSRVSNLASAFGGTTRTASSKISIAKPVGLSAREKAEEEALSGPRRRRLFGYKLLLYISYALSGRTFPKYEQISPLKLGK